MIVLLLFFEGGSGSAETHKYTHTLREREREVNKQRRTTQDSFRMLKKGNKG